MKIRFNINYKTVWGEQLYVTGSSPELGVWDPSRARPMAYTTGDEWKLELAFPDRKNIEFEYKYLVKSDKGAILAEGAPNRHFTLDGVEEGAAQAPYDLVDVRDWWSPATDPDSLFLSAAFSDVIFAREGAAIREKKKTENAARTNIRLQIIAPRIERDHSLYVSGNIPELGGSDIARAVPMDERMFPLWTLDIPVNEEKIAFNYKYAIKDKRGKPVLAEEGNDRVIAIGADFSSSRKLCIVNDFKFRYPNRWRGAGLAVPVFSLRTKDGLGVGEFLDIKPLADWAAQCGLKLIQILPVNDTSVTLTWWDSYPYGNLSVFALHPIYMNIPAIGDIPKSVSEEIASRSRILNGYDHVNYEEVMAVKMKALREIFQAHKTKFLASKEFTAFFGENSFWLEPYASFSALRDIYKTSDYHKWDRSVSASYDQMAFYYFVQYHLHLQLEEASAYANSKGVVLKGDIPIGIHKHSDSCWTHPELFNMDQQAGAPPDPFSDTGQNWGFPTYNWQAMAGDGYLWWRRRLLKMSEYFQMIRLDHVLGFFRIWEIPEAMVSGLMGHFNPAIPLSQRELESQGIWDFNRLCDPYIPAWLVKIVFGPESSRVIAAYLDQDAGHYKLKPEFSSQAAVEAHLALPENAPEDQKERNQKIRDGLFALIANIILFRDEKVGGFHPRINMIDTCSFDGASPEWPSIVL